VPFLLPVNVSPLPGLHHLFILLYKQCDGSIPTLSIRQQMSIIPHEDNQAISHAAVSCIIQGFSMASGFRFARVGCIVHLPRMHRRVLRVAYSYCVE